MKSHVDRYPVEFDDLTVGGRNALIGFTRVVEWHRELYGADADGRRGIMTCLLDDDRAEGVYVQFEDNGWASVPREALAEPERAEVDGLVEKHLELTEPELDEGPDGPDPDYDPYD